MESSYNLTQVNTHNIAEVGQAVVEIYSSLYPDGDGTSIPAYFEAVESMFEGRYKDYQAMDTSYHDLDHTMQATLCFLRLMANRQRAGITPLMAERDFHIGLVAILLHDVGYLKKRSDREGTGAKFTFVHERRSCEVADLFLTDLGWPKADIFAVQHLISCTGPRSLIDSIPFERQIERIMGEAVCTADYLGQMSDPKYAQKLPVLFEEFEESDDYRKVPPADRMFKSSNELLKGTPLFWEKVVIPKLEEDCHGLCRFLEDPYPGGPNPYIDAVEDNIAKVLKLVEQFEQRAAS